LKVLLLFLGLRRPIDGVELLQRTDFKIVLPFFFNGLAKAVTVLLRSVLHHEYNIMNTAQIVSKFGLNVESTWVHIFSYLNLEISNFFKNREVLKKKVGFSPFSNTLSSLFEYRPFCYIVDM